VVLKADRISLSLNSTNEKEELFLYDLMCLIDEHMSDRVHTNPTHDGKHYKNLFRLDIYETKHNDTGSARSYTS